MTFVRHEVRSNDLCRKIGRAATCFLAVDRFDREPHRPLPVRLGLKERHLCGGFSYHQSALHMDAKCFSNFLLERAPVGDRDPAQRCRAFAFLAQAAFAF